MKTARALTFAAALALAPAMAFAGDLYNVNESNVAIEGYDPVAYHVAGQPMKGDPAHAYDWHDATWHFASAEHRELFAREPDRYAPQFGGFCSGAMVKGIVASIDPEEWVIVDGQLFLGGRPGAVDYLSGDRNETLANAQANWSRLNASD
jgi:hypothetical protein